MFHVEQFNKIILNYKIKFQILANEKKQITMKTFEHHYLDIDTGEEITKNLIKYHNYVKIGKSDSKTINNGLYNKTIIKWHKYRKPEFRNQELKFSDNT